ncbi:MAG TPA: class I SAM-dependent methyltransferase [Anaerolineales bacterium]|nr:class I SAM-dependent methyltransferase [Anaerolineales bacterium]
MLNWEIKAFLNELRSGESETNLLYMVVVSLLFLIVILSALWMIVPAFYGPPSVPTRMNRIRKALEFANLQPGETIYDLGAGDGRVLLIAAGEFNANAVGVEVGPVQCLLIKLRALASGHAGKIRVKWGNYFKVGMKDADVVFIYATSKETNKLAAHLKDQMKPGSRLVSISADFSEWEPSAMDDLELIFLYAMPPTEGGTATYLMKRSNAS